MLESNLYTEELRIGNLKFAFTYLLATLSTSFRKNWARLSLSFDRLSMVAFSDLLLRSHYYI